MWLSISIYALICYYQEYYNFCLHIKTIWLILVKIIVKFQSISILWKLNLFWQSILDYIIIMYIILNNLNKKIAFWLTYFFQLWSWILYVPRWMLLIKIGELIAIKNKLVKNNQWECFRIWTKYTSSKKEYIFSHQKGNYLLFIPRWISNIRWPYRK